MTLDCTTPMFSYVSASADFAKAKSGKRTRLPYYALSYSTFVLLDVQIMVFSLFRMAVQLVLKIGQHVDFSCIK